MMKRTWLGIVSVLATVVGTTGCSGPLDSEEHGEAFGMEIVTPSGTVLASVNSARQVTGSLATTAGNSIEFDIYFLDGDGDRFQLPSDDDEIELVWQVVNASIAEVEAVGSRHRLVGKAAGSTSVQFSILHGGHSDYEAPLIPITVSATE